MVSVYDWSLIGGKGEFVGLQNYRDVLGQPVLLEVGRQHPQHLPALVRTSDRDRARPGRPAGHRAARRDVLADGRAAAVRGRAGRRGDHLRQPVRRPLRPDQRGARAGSGCPASPGTPTGWPATSPSPRWSTGAGPATTRCILLAAMQAVPRDLYDAAAIDGASRFRQFTSITVPSIRPTVIFVVITSTIGGLQIFAEPRMFDSTLAQNGGSDRQFSTMTMLVYDFGWHLRDLGRASATAWLLFLLIIVIALVNYFLSRRFGTLAQARGDGDDAASRVPRLRPAGGVHRRLGAAALLVVPDRLAHQGGDHPRRAAAAAGRPLPRATPSGSSTPCRSGRPWPTA